MNARREKLIEYFDINSRDRIEGEEVLESWKFIRQKKILILFEKNRHNFLVTLSKGSAVYLLVLLVRYCISWLGDFNRL